MDNCIFQRLRRLFWAIVNPSHWVRNYETNKNLDEFVNQLLDTCPKVLKIDKYYCTFETIDLWITNYAYGSAWGRNGLPRRTTCIRLKEYIEENTKC